MSDPLKQTPMAELDRDNRVLRDQWAVEAAVAAERERCARIVEQIGAQHADETMSFRGGGRWAAEVAAAIRKGE